MDDFIEVAAQLVASAIGTGIGWLVVAVVILLIIAAMLLIMGADQ